MWDGWGAGYEAAGWNIDPDEAVQTAKWAVEDGCDFVSVSIFGHSPTHIAAKHKDSHDAMPLVKKFRHSLPEDTVLMVCGGVESAKDVKALLDAGVDVAVTGKSGISTPDFPKQCIADPDFAVTVKPRYTPEFLASVDVSPPFVDFMRSIGLAQ
jgi:hypothetical protein